MASIEDNKSGEYKPVPKPRNISLNSSVIVPSKPVDIGQDNEVFTECSQQCESSLEEVQNKENDIKLKSIRSKSYAAALETDSLDVKIPEDDSAYKPTGMSLIADVVKQKERPKPTPRPRPSKSQSMDDIKTKHKESTENEINAVKEGKSPKLPHNELSSSRNSKLIPVRLAPPVPMKSKSPSDSDVVPANLSQKSKMDSRPKSTTWYDTDIVVKSPFPEKTDTKSNLEIQEAKSEITLRDDVKLPTRKEKHSGFLSGSHIFETIKSWTVGTSSKHNKIDKVEHAKKDRSSRFYCSVSDDNLDRMQTTSDDLMKTKLPSPTSKMTVESGNKPPSPSVLSDSQTKEVVKDTEEAPPLPPPRVKKKARGDSYNVEYTSPEKQETSYGTEADDLHEFKPATLNLMEEINEKLENLDVTMKSDELAEESISPDLCSVDINQNDFPRDNRSFASNLDEQTSSEMKCSNQNNPGVNMDSENYGSDFPKNIDSPDFANSLLDINPVEQFNELDIMIPPAGFVPQKVTKNVPSSSDAAPLEQQNDEYVVLKETKPAAHQERKQKINRNSDLDIIVYEDHEGSSTDSEYYDGYVEPEGGGCDDGGGSNDKSNVSDSIPVDSVPPALPPRARSASPSLLTKSSPISPCNQTVSVHDEQTDSSSITPRDQTVHLLDKQIDSPNKNSETCIVDSDRLMHDSNDSSKPACLADDKLASPMSDPFCSDNSDTVFTESLKEVEINKLTINNPNKSKNSNIGSKSSDCEHKSPLDSVIPLNSDDENKDLESTLKPGVILPVHPHPHSSDSSSSDSEDEIRGLPDEDSYSVTFNRNSANNASFSGSTASSSDFGTTPPLYPPVKLRKRPVSRVSSDDSDCSNRPSSWASFGSGASDYVPWFNASGHRVSQSQSLDLLHKGLGSPNISLSSARSSMSSLEQSDNEDNDEV